MYNNINTCKYKYLTMISNYIYYNQYMGIGDWGLGIGDWAQSPIPNPQSPIPNNVYFYYKY